MVDSATGGYLQPDSSPPDGNDLNDLFQQAFAAITALDGRLVRPAFQDEPPNIPQAATAWMAFRYVSRPSDTFPAVAHDPAGSGSDQLQRHEEIRTLCSFYDTGTGGQANFYLARLRDGLAIPQNREALKSVGISLVAVEEPTDVPVLIKMRWQYRSDLPISFRRVVQRVYSVRNVASLVGSLVTDSGLSAQL